MEDSLTRIHTLFTSSQGQQMNNKTTVQLIDSNYKNALFEENMAYFKQYNPTMYKDLIGYQCIQYRLFLNPDDSPNIVEVSGNAIYPIEALEETMLRIQEQISTMERIVSPQGYFDLENEKALRQSPIQTELYRKLSNCGPLNDLDWEHIPSNQGADYCPLVRVYGIGLGYHLSELIKQRNITHMIIYEPNVDLFYLSLYTTPWKLIFNYFELNDAKNIKLLVGLNATEAEAHTSAYLEATFRYLPISHYRLNHFKNSPDIHNIIEETSHADTKLIMTKNMGWYEDQRAGLFYTIKNIKNKVPLYSGKKAKNFLRIFVVGSGPSLDNSIKHIKEHQNEALIISSGSALTPLLKSDIIPDFQVIQERFWEEFESRHDPSILKKIELIQLSVVRHNISEYYNKCYMTLKPNDPSIAIFNEKHFGLRACNPTVTNMSISLAAHFGANEIYLFGIDYGAPIGAEKMHSSNSMYDEKSEEYTQLKGYTDSTIDQHETYLPGNFSKKIVSTYMLSWSKSTTETLIEKFPDIEWINIGDGAFISGTKSVKDDNFPSYFGTTFNKREALLEIRNLFGLEYLEDINLDKLPERIEHESTLYFDAILGFLDSTPKTREELLHVLTLMSKAVDHNAYDQNFIPPLLMSGGIMHYIQNLFIQLTLTDHDSKVEEFFSNAKIYLKDYLATVLDDSIKLTYDALNNNIDHLDSGDTYIN